MFCKSYHYHIIFISGIVLFYIFKVFDAVPKGSQQIPLTLELSISLGLKNAWKERMNAEKEDIHR